ncbi:MAG TPA: hypothetical protein ENN80_07255, partial [Candidatus Hydrogenedentes bacterium]|nr:hypothetical protein [Candidatus Hydrogenedentota bacterium]
MEGKLGWHSLNTTFECSCGVTHKLPIEACHVGGDAAKRMGAFARARCGQACLVIADENTRRAAGDAPFSALSVAGKHVSEHTFG